MEIGQLVTYAGKGYYLRGLDPMSVRDRRADLVDPMTGARVVAPLADVHPWPSSDAAEHHLDLADGGASPENP